MNIGVFIMEKKYILGAVIGLLIGIIVYTALSYDVKTNTQQELMPMISARNAVLINQETGEVMYQKQADAKAYPASTTKIMTALVALSICEEVGANLEQMVIVPKEATAVEGSSIYLKAGEKISIEELLYGLMLQSGNDAATAIAMTLGGTEENFIARMNKKAQELGCTNTHFTNPSGLHNDDHYTTARELGIIAQEAMKNKWFRKVVATENWKNYYNKNKTVHQYKGATGIKIGFTETSGRTLVASAKRGGAELICVVLSDGNWFNDAYNLMDYGFKLIGIAEPVD